RRRDRGRQGCPGRDREAGRPRRQGGLTRVLPIRSPEQEGPAGAIGGPFFVLPPARRAQATEATISPWMWWRRGATPSASVTARRPVTSPPSKVKRAPNLWASARMERLAAVEVMRKCG